MLASWTGFLTYSVCRPSAPSATVCFHLLNVFEPTTNDILCTSYGRIL
jgi:hypothetical protein